MDICPHPPIGFDKYRIDRLISPAATIDNYRGAFGEMVLQRRTGTFLAGAFDVLFFWGGGMCVLYSHVAVIKINILAVKHIFRSF